MAQSLGNETLSLLLEKYPELFFLLSYGNVTAQESKKRIAPREAQMKLQALSLSELSTLYVYGMAPCYYPLLLPWLSEKKERRLIFLIYDLSSLLEEDPCMQDLIACDQVVLFHFVEQERSIQELVSRFPCNLVEVLPSISEEDPSLISLRLEILRKSTLANALFAETLHSPQLLGNILANLSFWDRSFLANKWRNKFAKIPAIICGAGPSLQREIPHLRNLMDRALVLAGGSTMTALSSQGIFPHLGFAIDPNKEEFDRLKEASCMTMPLLYGTRLNQDVLPCFAGPFGYIVSGTGGPCESYFEEVLQMPQEMIGPEMGMEALSVTTLALAYAVHMGCNPILFCGVDLAYTQGKRYASEALSSVIAPLQDLDMRSAERFLQKEGIDGKPVNTLIKWIMESECIGAFAKNMDHTRFINVSQGGLGFPGIENLSLTDVMEHVLTRSYDLSARVHAQVQESLSSLSSERIKQEKKIIKASLESLLQQVDQIIEEIQKEGIAFPSARFLFLEMEAKEEIAFSCFNPYVEAAFDRLMERWFLPGDSNRDRSSSLAKYKAFRRLLSEQQELFTL